jgi:hypothetical protein
MPKIISSDTALRVKAMHILVEYLGAVNTERFITSIKNDHFDYTEWQRDLWKDKSIEELHAEASEFYHRRYEGELATHSQRGARD